MEIFKILPYFDLFCLLLVLSIGISSYFKGFLKIIFSIAYIIASFLITLAVSESIKAFVFSKYGEIELIKFIAFGVVFLVSYFLLKLIFSPIISGFEGNANYSWVGGFNRGLGFVVGLVKGLFIVFILVFLYEKYIKEFEFNDFNRLIESSYTYKIIGKILW